MHLSKRDILRFMWKAQDKYYGYWLQGYTIHACAPDSTRKATAVVGSTPIKKKFDAEYLLSTLPDLLFHIVHILFRVVLFCGNFMLD